MSLSPEQLREQMIDYLYGELEGDALDHFESALAESEQGQRELAALQATLRVARTELARDDNAQPPPRVRDAVLRAAQSQLRAAKEEGSADKAFKWLRSLWILPSLVAATAAIVMVLRQDRPVLVPGSRSEQAPSPAAEPAEVHEAAPVGPRATQDETSPAPAPPAAAEKRSAGPAPRKPPAAPSGNKSRFAAPPPAWQRGSSAEADQTQEAAASAAPETPTTLGAARQRAAAPAIARPSADTAAPLTAAALERRAHEHAAAKRWAQAAADYRELLRRFPQDPHHKLWTEQLALAVHAAGQD